MTQEDDIARKLKEYDEAFDFYMDAGRLPEQIQPDDMLGGFIGQTIDENPQLSSQDPLWVELLKEELMKFLEAMLQLFMPIEERHREEKNFIQKFADGGLDKKRTMWRQVQSFVTTQYKPEEVNMDGYIKQFKEHESVPVLNALVKDWDKACDEREDRQKRQMLEIYRQKWERQIKEHGMSDYQERQKLEKFFYSYPQLIDIVRIIGREQPKRDDEMDDTVIRYLPLLPSPPKPVAEVEEIAVGKDLQHLIPSEMAILSDQQTETLFYMKYASEQLQLFANRPKERSVLKTEQQQLKKPRLEKGPIIVGVDTSGSMSGKPKRIAFALLKQLLRLARKQKRNCFLMTFSVRSRCLDLSLPHNWQLLNQFLENSFTGGTDGEEMLNTAIKMIQTDQYAMADVLIISDFYFSLPLEPTRKKMEVEHCKGTRFYGLRINSDEVMYDKILDKTWNIK